MVIDYNEIAKKAGIDITIEHVDEVGDSTNSVKDAKTLEALHKAIETGEKQILDQYYWKFDDETITFYMLPNGYVITTSQKGNLIENV